MHPDGYVELRDRSKDVIISGGENIASVEVEHAIASHPAVLEVAVIAVPDERWGEVPAAYVTLHAGKTAHRRGDHRPRPGQARAVQSAKRVVFTELPKTSTGRLKSCAAGQEQGLKEKLRVRVTSWGASAGHRQRNIHIPLFVSAFSKKRSTQYAGGMRCQILATSKLRSAKDPPLSSLRPDEDSGANSLVGLTFA